MSAQSLREGVHTRLEHRGKCPKTVHTCIKVVYAAHHGARRRKPCWTKEKGRGRVTVSRLVGRESGSTQAHATPEDIPGSHSIVGKQIQGSGDRDRSAWSEPPPRLYEGVDNFGRRVKVADLDTGGPNGRVRPLRQEDASPTRASILSLAGAGRLQKEKGEVKREKKIVTAARVLERETKEQGKK
ncbi:hypothetical protein B0H11DRAFT_1936653 [Mycena galericulata]|nr:hypothetical protein B0H11DRAFT_1936653 [Mycena galericulata]